MINYVFGLTLIYLFILEGRVEDHIQILTGFGLAVLLATISFFANWITLDATKAVIIVGTIFLGFGGWVFAASVVFFFLISSILSSGRVKPYKSKGMLSHHMRRDGYQVWANGFWAAVFCTIWFATGAFASLIAAFAVVGAATADTWATEVGMKKPGKTVRITDFKKVEPGEEGGVSLKGTLAAVFGAAAISAFIFLTDLSSAGGVFMIIFGSGFIAAIADSILGAVFQKKQLHIAEPEDYSSETETFKNSVINWLSTGIGGLTAFTLTQLVVA